MQMRASSNVVSVKKRRVRHTLLFTVRCYTADNGRRSRQANVRWKTWPHLLSKFSIQLEHSACILFTYFSSSLLDSDSSLLLIESNATSKCTTFTFISKTY